MSLEPQVVSPFTGVAGAVPWGRKDGRGVYECPATGAIFFDRSDLGEEDYQEYYPYLADFDADRMQWELDVRRPKYQRQLATMQRFVEGRTLLDVGAGPGYLCRVAEEQGWEARGVEIAAEAVRAGEEHFQARYVPLDEVEDGSVDAVTCHHVLEHIAEPVEFLAALHAKLKPGGLLVLHVPHQQPLTFAIRAAIRRRRGSDEDFCCLYGDVHISGFTSRSLKTFVERSGFDTHFVRTAGMWTKYYDPFFVRTYLRDRAWATAGRKFVRHGIESLGSLFGTGDWVVGYFSKGG